MPGTKVLQNIKVPRYTSEQLQKILKLTSIHNSYIEHHVRRNSSSYFNFVLKWETLQRLEVYFTRLELPCCFFTVLIKGNAGNGILQSTGTSRVSHTTDV